MFVERWYDQLISAIEFEHRSMITSWRTIPMVTVFLCCEMCARVRVTRLQATCLSKVVAVPV
jgi:hypothetical protein